jgi:hypothetical protein
MVASLVLLIGTGRPFSGSNFANSLATHRYEDTAGIAPILDVFFEAGQAVL